MSNSNVNSLLIKSNPSRCHQVLILAQNQKRKCESAELAALLVAVKITFVIITNITIFPWNVTNSNSNLELHACYHVCFWIMEFICPLTNSCWPVGTTDYGRMISRFQILYGCIIEIDIPLKYLRTCLLRPSWKACALPLEELGNSNGAIITFQLDVTKM